MEKLQQSDFIVSFLLILFLRLYCYVCETVKLLSRYEGILYLTTCRRGFTMFVFLMLVCTPHQSTRDTMPSVLNRLGRMQPQSDP